MSAVRVGTKRLVFGKDAIVSAWVSKRIDIPVPTDAVALGVWDGDRLIAGVMYTEYRGCDITMHVAAENARWLNRQFLHAFFGYPFLQLKVLRVTAIVARRNQHARKFVERIGFKREGSHPRAFNGRTAISYGMMREHCRWLIGENYGQTNSKSAASA